MQEIRGQLKETLRHLSDGKWHSLFSIHERFRLSPDKIHNCIEYLTSKNIIDIEERNIRIKNSISDELISELVYIFKFSKPNINDDQRFIAQKSHSINELYLPRIDLLSKELRDNS